MTPTDASKLLGIKRRTIHHWCHSGIIDATWVPHGSLFRIHISRTALLRALTLYRHVFDMVGQERCYKAINTLNKAERDEHYAAARDAAGGR